METPLRISGTEAFRLLHGSRFRCLYVTTPHGLFYVKPKEAVEYNYSCFRMACRSYVRRKTNKPDDKSVLALVRNDMRKHWRRYRQAQEFVKWQD